MPVNDPFYHAFGVFEQRARVLLEVPQTGASPAQELELSNGIADQQRALNEAAGSMPSYDIRRYQTALDDLRDVLRSRVKAKPKFAFKTRPTPSTTRPTKARPEKLEPDLEREDFSGQTIPGALIISGSELQGIQIDVHTHKELLNASTVTLESIANATVDLTRSLPYTSVTVRKLHSCRINAASCTSSLFIDQCTECSITGDAQQIRVHSSADCQVRYVCRAGKPVIEDCQSMKFGNLVGEGVDSSTAVDDFSDLSGDRHNWSIIQGFS